MGFTQLLLLLLARAVLAEQVFEDSPALTSLWQATSSGSTEAFVSQLIQNREYAQHRSADGRGPLFWSYEFKNMDTLALLMHLSVSLDQEDVEGSKASTFFAGSAEELAGKLPHSLPTLLGRHNECLTDRCPLRRIRSRREGQGW